MRAYVYDDLARPSNAHDNIEAVLPSETATTLVPPPEVVLLMIENNDVDFLKSCYSIMNNDDDDDEEDDTSVDNTMSPSDDHYSALMLVFLALASTMLVSLTLAVPPSIRHNKRRLRITEQQHARHLK